MSLYRRTSVTSFSDCGRVFSLTIQRGIGRFVPWFLQTSQKWTRCCQDQSLPSSPLLSLNLFNMLIPTRYYLLVVVVLISARYLFGIWGSADSRSAYLTALAEKWKHAQNAGLSYITDGDPNVSSSLPISLEEEPRRANASFVILARNGELKEVIESLKQIEDRFNRKYHYPYVFLNEQPFTNEFKRWTQEVISSKAHYGVIPPDHWYQPGHIDEARAAMMRQTLVDDDVIYGGSVSYRNMCRFNSGFFYRHPLMQQFRYYWRVEPGVKFFCDIETDPFLYMQDHNKTYGFTISLYEYERTIPSLWVVTKEFMRRHPEYLPEDNALSFISDDQGETYNLCHFWSNFEIADMDLWRSEAYTKYFEFLDSVGGFYYERWGDAPVHSIGAALFSRKDQIHFFREIGYRHDPFQHCPQGDHHRNGKCWCEEKDNFDYDGYSCTYRYDRLFT
ncbi:alpha 1,2-mannosyltransferase 2.4.1 [Serendipita sp. 396]|nr:alpha 1,2-mannosyltransferase 2.4.1 [Serendipita sp. 396]KAG8781552.1 alpha 1,2-mannosyltransferase 2.4.1 [Serendipita sp. 397]